MDLKKTGVIYGLQQIGYAIDYALKYANQIYPEGLFGQPVSFWGDLVGTIAGALGALGLSAPYDLAFAMVGSYLSTDLWNHLARIYPMRVATPPQVTYTPAETVTPPAPFVTGRYQITG